MIKNSADIMIGGGGMIGLSLAIALAQAGLQVAVFEPTPHHTQTLPQFDGRVSAIALGSQRILKNIGVWADMQPHAQPISDIRVVDSRSPAFVHYDHQDLGSDPFGYIIENRHTRMALLERAASLKNINIISPVSVAHYEAKQGMAVVTLTSGEQWSAPLLIAADGKSSSIRAASGIQSHTLGYPHAAIVCTITHEKPHHGLALERFFPVGPFAVLPMQGNRSSLVWTEPNAIVADMVKLDDSALAAEIQQRTGDYLGKISVSGPRFSYPLSVTLARSYTAPRMALIGDAAHAIHPIAGQGVNMGFRDVAALEQVITDAWRLGVDVGAADVLAHYQRWRRFDNLAMTAVTDGLTRLFSNNIVPLKLARDLGLMAVNKMSPVKRFFMRHAMGLTGDLPRLMHA